MRKLLNVCTTTMYFTLQEPQNAADNFIYRNKKLLLNLMKII